MRGIGSPDLSGQDRQDAFRRIREGGHGNAGCRLTGRSCNRRRGNRAPGFYPAPMPSCRAFVVMAVLVALLIPASASATTGAQLNASLSKSARGLGPTSGVLVKKINTNQ